MKSLLPLIVGLFFLVSILGKTLRREDKRTFVDTEITDERERWMYRYDGTAHQLIFRARFEHNTPCYVYNINDADRALAHTTTGMLQLQVRNKYYLNVEDNCKSIIGYDQVSGGDSGSYWVVKPVTNVLWKPYEFT